MFRRYSILIIFLFFVFPALLSAQLNGTYTIGSGGDYTTFKSATDALHNEGVSGPVTFNVLAGTYPEQFSIGIITGVSATNSILFRSQAGNYKSVTLQPDPVSGLYNYAVKLEGAQYPGYLSDEDLYTNSLWLSGKGIPLSSITEDINGAARKPGQRHLLLEYTS